MGSADAFPSRANRMEGVPVLQATSPVPQCFSWIHLHRTSPEGHQPLTSKSTKGSPRSQFRTGFWGKPIAQTLETAQLTGPVKGAAMTQWSETAAFQWRQQTPAEQQIRSRGMDDTASWSRSGGPEQPQAPAVVCSSAKVSSGCTFGSR